MGLRYATRLMLIFLGYAKQYLHTHAFIMKLEACGVTISISNEPIAPVIDDGFGVLVEL
jgi:hypothetical protein